MKKTTKNILNDLDKDLVSIIVPIYNVESYILECLVSIVEQTYKNIELIMVNDGTKDRSVVIAEQYLNSVNFDYKLINKVNNGLSAARNTGLDNCTGDWVIFVDSDDVLDSRFIEILLENAIVSNADISIVNYRKFNDRNVSNIVNSKTNNKSNKKVILNNEQFIPLFLKRHIHFVIPSMIIKTNIIKNKIYFDESVKYSEDQLYVWNIMSINLLIVYSIQELYYYRQRSDSIMSSSNKEKVLSGYYGLKKFVEKSDSYQVRKLHYAILSRWIIGSMHSSSKFLSFNDFKSLYKTLSSNLRFAHLYKEMKVVLAFILLKINLKISYIFMKKL